MTLHSRQQNQTHIRMIAADDNHEGRGCEDDACGGWVVFKAPELSYPAIIEAYDRMAFYASTGPEIHGCFIEDGVFHGTVQNASNNAGAGAIAGGTFNGYVNNYDGAVISSGTFNDGGENNNVTNDGTIRGGEFNIGVDNGGAIEGQGVFNAYVQNGYMRFDPDENRSCTIKGGTFNSDEIDNFGTIEGGTFSGKILSRGVIAGGAFSSTSSVTSNDEDTTTGGGTISGGTFDGTVTNGDPDPDYNNAVLTGGTFNGSVTNHGTIAGGTFLSDVTNRGVIEGGIFENVISDQGGTVTSCAYPLRANLTGLSIAAVPSAMPKNTAAGFPAEPSAALTAAFEKDGADANLYQLSANEGYLLPDAIDVRCGAADGQTLALAAGTDYTYDPATGAIAIKKSVVTGPLLLAAQGAAAPTPPVPPTPDTPAPAPEPETPAPKPESKPDAPKPLPSTTDSKQAPANAAALAATGDAPLPQIALGIALLAGGVTLTCAIAMQITRKKRSNRS